MKKEIKDLKAEIKRNKEEIELLNIRYKNQELKLNRAINILQDLKEEYKLNKNYNDNIKEILEELEKNILQDIKLKEYRTLDDLIDSYIKLRNEVK